MELFKQRLTEQLNNKSDDVASGCAKDYADYRYRIGVIQGLSIAEIEFSEILKNYEES